VRCIEAEVMDLSDDIAYSVHDFEDAIVNGYLDPARLGAGSEHSALLNAIQSWVGFDFARDELEDALYRLMRMPEWIGSFDGTRASHAQLKNLTSDLIGRFCRAATEATHREFGHRPLARYTADLVVPEDTALEIAVLKGVAAHLVMRAEDRVELLNGQREVVRGLVEALTAADPEVLEPRFRADLREASDTAGRLRVVVDQVASLTDASALEWHVRLC
jgi:dGTPase